MILEDLITEFDNLSDDEQMKLILSIRASRRISKKSVVVKPEKTASKTADKKAKTAKLSIDALSPQMAALLLQKLKGVSNETT